VIKSFYESLNEFRNMKHITQVASEPLNVVIVKPNSSENKINDIKKEAIDIEKSNSYRAMIIEKIDSHRVLSDNENEVVDVKKDIKSFNTIVEDITHKDVENHSDYVKKLQMNKLLRSQAKFDNDFEAENPNLNIKYSQDISSSDLIYKTRILLLKSNKFKSENLDRPVSRNNEKDDINNRLNNNFSNNISHHKYKHKYNDLGSKGLRNNYVRNISSNLKDLKTKSALYDKNTQFTNFNYKPYQKTNFISNMKETNISKEIKDFKNYKDSKDIYKSNKHDKVFNQEIIKKKIDREIYSRQKVNYVHLGSGNNSKEIHSNNHLHFADQNELFLSKVKQIEDNRNLYFDYMHDLNQNLIHF